MPINTGIVLGGNQQPAQRDPIQQLAALMQIMQAQKQGQLTDLELQQKQQAMPFQLAQLQAQAEKAKRVEQFYSPQNIAQFAKPEYAAVAPGPDGMGPSRDAGPSIFDVDKMLNAGAMQGVIDPEKLADHRAKLAQAKATQEATAQARADAIQARLYDIDSRSQDRQLSREQAASLALESNRLREDLARMQISSREDLALSNAGGRAQTTTIADPKNPNNTLVVNVNKFDAEKYLAGDNTGVIGLGPKLTQTGTASFKQAAQMQGFASDIQMAEDLLSGQRRDQYGNVMPAPKPTGSGIGRGVDWVGDQFGISVPGASEAADLKAVAARLTMRVPRFEGPQSDKDVAQYKEAAAQAGNDKVARETRLSAVRKMREIYTGYEDGTRGRIVQEQVQGGSTAPSAPNSKEKPYALKNSKGWPLMRDPVSGVRAYLAPDGKFEVVP